jgi:integrase
MGRRSESTRLTYECGLDAFARCFGVQLVDLLIAKIKSGELEAYSTLDKFVSWLDGNGAAPKTIWIYVGAVKSLLEHEDVLLDKRKLRKLQLPAKVEVSVDRIPTKQELRTIILNANPCARALITLLATSGMRIGEAGNLHIANLELLKNKVTIVANRTKSRRTRVTFITDETAGFIREYLGRRIDSKDEWLFPDPDNPSKPCPRNTLYMRIFRVLQKQGLRGKLDPDSRMYELHPHAFRKYFFTKLISAGVDRGVAEYLMGHKFGLDNAYLRMAEDRLRQEYLKAIDDFTFLTDTKAQQEAKKQIEELQKELRDRNVALVTFSQQSDEKFKTLQDKVESLTEAVQMMQDLNQGKWKWVAPEQVLPNASKDNADQKPKQYAR